MRASLIALGMLLLAGCAADLPVPGGAPVTYAGDLPCANCARQHVVLTLFPDGTYRLRRSYEGTVGGRDEVVYDLGRWTRAEEGRDRILLTGGHGMRTYAAVHGGLRAPDGGYALERRAAVDPVAGPTRLRGMYRSIADAATVDECLTGRTYPVLSEGDWRAMERAYRRVRPAPGAPVLATFDGQFVARAPEPGLAPRDHVRVVRFGRFWPGQACAAAAADAPLIGTVWRVTEIDGERVEAPGGRAPELVLSAQGDRVHGFAGCDRLVGGFERAGDGLRVMGATATRKACPPPARDIEAAFLDALNATARHGISGNILELRDAEGRVRMRLEAVPAGRRP